MEEAVAGTSAAVEAVILEAVASAEARARRHRRRIQPRDLRRGPLRSQIPGLLSRQLLREQIRARQAL
jgi:hypothetical protein